MVYKSEQSGFALLISLIIVAVVITVGVSILELTIKQVQLASNAKESEVAFHAANAGMECARFVRRDNSDDMEAGNPVSPSCFGGSTASTRTDLRTGAPSVSVTGAGNANQYEYQFQWGAGSDIRCTRVNSIVMSTPPAGSGMTLSNVPSIIPGYPDSNMTCEPGGRCSVISVKGYNQPCTNVTGFGVIQREVLLQF